MTDLEFKSDVYKMIKALDKASDWFLVSIKDKDEEKRLIARQIYELKSAEVKKIAQEMALKYGKQN